MYSRSSVHPPSAACLCALNRRPVTLRKVYPLRSIPNAAAHPYHQCESPLSRLGDQSLVKTRRSHLSLTQSSDVTAKLRVDPQSRVPRIIAAMLQSILFRSHRCGTFASVISSRPLEDLYADACVPVNRGDDLIFHTKRLDKFFKGSEFVEWARKLVKENKISILQVRRQGGQDKER